EREFSLDLITTVPNVEYHVVLTSGDRVAVENPTALPDRGRIERIEEPYVRARIVCPAEFIGNVQKLCHERRGEYRSMSYLDPTRVEFHYELPLAEIVLDRSEEHTSELQSRENLVCRLLLEKKKFIHHQND